MPMLLMIGCADKTAPVNTPRPPDYCYRIDRHVTEAMRNDNPGLITDEDRRQASVCTRRYIVGWECARDLDSERCQLAERIAGP